MTRDHAAVLLAACLACQGCAGTAVRRSGPPAAQTTRSSTTEPTSGLAPEEEASRLREAADYAREAGKPVTLTEKDPPLWAGAVVLVGLLLSILFIAR